MPTRGFAVTDTPQDLVAGLALDVGQYYVQNSNMFAVVHWSEEAAAPGAGDPHHVLGPCEDGVLIVEADTKWWAWSPTGSARLAVTESA